jgi:hypothetical protein
LAELAGELPDDVLFIEPMRDVWMRDFTPVRPTRPVLFPLFGGRQAGQQREADWVQAASSAMPDPRAWNSNAAPMSSTAATSSTTATPAPSSPTASWPTTASTRPRPSPSCAKRLARSTSPSCRPIPKTGWAMPTAWWRSSRRT